ncbi:SPOR domain-containing protein [Litorilituus sediminis]|nr:SPOR domain-containing protein [Litorilituus sediminis]
MTALAPSIDKPNEKNIQTKVTAISVTARIDYVLKFSKQLVLAVDDNAQSYSAVASQYLSTLGQSPEKSEQALNVAFVSASTKLNDIQMRCRIIEQLFANTLFDPEQSLAVSIIKLANQQQQDITIVLDHAQALSLQLKYELSQLVAISSKAKLAINVVLFASQDAVRDIVTNKELFKGKLTIVDANSGQIIKASQQQFPDNSKLISPATLYKISLAVLALLLFTALSYFAISQYEEFSLANLPDKAIELGSEAKPAAQEKMQVSNVEQQELTVAELSESVDIAVAVADESASVHNDMSKAELESPIEQASNEEIVSAIVAGALQVETAEVISADTSDVLQALTHSELTSKVVASESHDLDANYYLDTGNGYTVQIAGFAKLELWQKFIDEHKELALYSYKRKFADSQMIVVTTEVFATKTEASQALSSLPEQIKSRGPWIKANSAIVGEINTFKQ